MIRPSLRTIQIATPCPAQWDDMAGDERRRFCAHCQRTVYNLSAMTRAQANRLLMRTEGQVCTRLYRRADQTVMTADCPFGFRAIRRKVSRIAGAALSTALSFYAAGLAQTPAQSPDQGQSSRSTDRALTGVVMDASGAAIAHAHLTLSRQSAQDQITVASSDALGRFAFSGLPTGVYALTAESPGFLKFERINLLLGSGGRLNLLVELAIGRVTMGGPIVLAAPDKSKK